MTKDGQLAIPHSVALTPSGLTISADLSFEEWERLGETLKIVHHASLFWLGDWLNYGEAKYGEMYAQAVDATDYKEGTLQNAKWVARQIESSRRRDTRSWSHHAELAALEPDEQEEWMDRSEQGDGEKEWSVRRLRAELRRHRAEKEGQEIKMRATILVKVEGSRVGVFLNCDTHELEMLLGPVVDEVKSVVEEALIPVDNLAVDVKN